MPHGGQVSGKHNSLWRHEVLVALLDGGEHLEHFLRAAELANAILVRPDHPVPERRLLSLLPSRIAAPTAATASSSQQPPAATRRYKYLGHSPRQRPQQRGRRPRTPLRRPRPPACNRRVAVSFPPIFRFPEAFSAAFPSDGAIDAEDRRHATELRAGKGIARRVARHGWLVPAWAALAARCSQRSATFRRAKAEILCVWGLCGRFRFPRPKSATTKQEMIYKHVDTQGNEELLRQRQTRESRPCIGRLTTRCRLVRSCSKCRGSSS